MDEKKLNLAGGPVPGWQQRRGGVQVYFCCCPFALLLAPFLIVARLLHHGMLRLLGFPVASPWAQVRVAPQEVA